ncbi:MAG TPA: UdgX family uracil-DNA binding protein [Acidisarcina sp.]
MALKLTTAEPFVPQTHDLPVLREAVQGCRGCDLYNHATQAVFGEVQEPSTAANAHIDIMMIGEQPGDKEDLEGRPFVGPAGKLLDQCLAEAGIDRRKVYVTNAVKHFKWEPRGKLRLHKKPTLREVAACKPWLQAELDAVSPRLILCLGATAAQSLLGSAFKVTQSRGEVQNLIGMPPIMATVHPSSILRATDEDRAQQMRAFIDDLKLVKVHLG